MQNEGAQVSSELQAEQSVLEKLQDIIHEIAVSKGWWEEHELLRESLIAARHTVEAKYGKSLDPKLADDLYQFSRSMLIVSEVSEGIEALRCDNKADDKLPQFDGLSVELADAVIRILDLAGRFQLPVISAMLAKVEYNKGRSYKHGGKSI